VRQTHTHTHTQSKTKYTINQTPICFHLSRLDLKRCCTHTHTHCSAHYSIT